eukprot:8915468-Pyramimonas_sp.AAC.1
MCVSMTGSAAALFDVILSGAARPQSVRRQACAAARSVSPARGASLCCPHFRRQPALRPNVCCFAYWAAPTRGSSAEE